MNIRMADFVLILEIYGLEDTKEKTPLMSGVFIWRVFSD
jgi:hypothetical protein